MVRSIRIILMHELGHFFCAKELGYNPRITFDIEGRNFYNTFESRDDIPKEIDLKNQAIITCGGMAAEEIFGKESEGFWGDVAHLFEVLKELAAISGKQFPYEKPFSMEAKVYAEYYDQAKKLLEKIGGKDRLEYVTDFMLDKYQIVDKEF